MFLKLFKIFKSSIVKKIEIIVVLSILISLCIQGILIYKITEKNIYDNTRILIKKNLTLLSMNLESTYFTIVAIMNDYFNDKYFKETIQKEYNNLSVNDKWNYNRNIIEHIIMPKSSMLKELNYTFIILKTGEVFTDYDDSGAIDTSEKEMFKTINDKYTDNSKRNYAITMFETEKELFSRPMLPFARSIENSNGNHIGWVVLFVDEAIFSQIYYEQGYNLDDSIMIVNSSGEIISHVATQQIGKNINEIFDGPIDYNKSIILNYNNNEYMLNSGSFFKDGWSIVNIVPTRMLFKDVTLIRSIIIFTIIFISLIVLIIDIIMVNKVAFPLKKLKMNAIEVINGNFDTRITVSGEDEIGDLARCFDKMLTRIRKLIDDIYMEQELKIQSEIKAYQAQINPHFLHNTLNNIKWLAVTQNNIDIVEAISSLGRILECAMRNKTGMARVKDEIELLKNYIYLQKFRYGNKFDVGFFINEEIYNFMAPILLLQPILENSIFHAIGDNSFIYIKISGDIEDNQLVFRVQDDGCGIAEETMANIFNDDTKDRNRIGLLNIKQRLKLKFGEGYDIKVSSRQGAGTEVILNLPIIREDNT
ncbi:MAG: hypothetical protein A2Y21_09850 [Clostridiales bacterium GWC2_40_7]|nr:MAG: hypothetical protein A2Y21_09850 [Clostridiales bacterium GWC2_40_7]